MKSIRLRFEAWSSVRQNSCWRKVGGFKVGWRFRPLQKVMFIANDNPCNRAKRLSLHPFYSHDCRICMEKSNLFEGFYVWGPGSVNSPQAASRKRKGSDRTR